MARKGHGVTCCDAAGGRVLDGVAPEGDVRGARALQLQRAAEGVGRLVRVRVRVRARARVTVMVRVRVTVRVRVRGWAACAIRLFSKRSCAHQAHARPGPSEKRTSLSTKVAAVAMTVSAPG